MYAWLEKELERERKRWTFVFFHHPPYSSGKHGSHLAIRKAWSPLFERAAVAVVLRADAPHTTVPPNAHNGRLVRPILPETSTGWRKCSASCSCSKGPAGVGPFERLGHGAVEIVDECQDPLAQFGGRGEARSLQ